MKHRKEGGEQKILLKAVERMVDGGQVGGIMSKDVKNIT